MQEPLEQSDSNSEASLESWSIQKDFRFEAAHRLENHNGKCSRLHGHSYKLEVEVGRNFLYPGEGSSKGMVVDYALISKVVNSRVIEIFDHRFIATEETPKAFLDVLDFTQYHTLKIPTSTAEWLAWVIGQILLDNDSMMQGVLRSVTLWETETSKATWHRFGYSTPQRKSRRQLVS